MKKFIIGSLCILSACNNDIPIQENISEKSDSIIIGTNDLKNANCYTDSKITAQQYATAKVTWDDFQGTHICSGILVSNYNVFLTASHCFDSTARVTAPGTEFTFWNWHPSCNGGTPTHQEYTALNVINNDVANDVIALWLGGNPAATWGWVPVNKATYSYIGKYFSIAQFPGGAPMQIHYSGTNGNCQGTAMYPSVFGHNCDTMGGSSGAGVMDYTTGKIMGIHTGNYNAGMNVGTKITAILPWLDPYLGY